MADLQKTIQIIFGATDNVSDVMQDMDTSVGGFAGSVEQATQPLSDLAGNILKVEVAITAMGAAALYYANDQAVKMSDVQASLTKVLGEGEGVAADYAAEIQELALRFGVAGEATTNTVADFRKAGFSISDSLGLTETALIGVKIAELNSTEAGTLLIRNIRGLGVEADQATYFMDAWNEVSNNYAATAKEVAIATGLISPAANSAGLSFDQLVGLVTPMIEILGSGAEAANALKVGLANLVSENKRVTTALGELGVSQRDANGELRLSGEILEDLGAKWPELTKSQQANYGILLFGKEQYVRMNIVLNDYDKVLKITELSINSQGSALKELEVALSKASTASERFSVALGFAAAAVGKQFLAETTGINESLTELAISFIKVVDGGGLKPLFDVLNPLLESFANEIDIIAENLPEAFDGLDFSGLIRSFNDIGLELGDIFGEVDLSSAEGLTEALQKILDGLASLNVVFAGVISGFSPVIDVFFSVANFASEADNSTAKFVGALIGYGVTINTFSGWLGGLSGVMGSLSDVIIILVGAKSLGLLPASFSAAGVSAGSLTKSLGRAGLWGAAYGVTLELATMLGETDVVRTGLGKLFDLVLGNPFEEYEKTLEKTAASQSALNDSNAKMADSTVGVADAHVKAFEETTKYDDVVNDLAKSTEKAEQETNEFTLSESRLALQMTVMGLATDGTNEILKKSGDIVKVASGEFEGWYKIVKDGVTTYERTKPALEEVTKATDKLAEATKKAAKEAEESEKRAQALLIKYAELEVEMEKIASNERIKTMEFFVELETAKVEADAERVVAAFDSIATSYAATSSLIADLYSGLDSVSGLDKLDLERSIAQAEKIALEEHEMQMRLSEAELERIQAATDRAKSGDSLITVDGGELQPELEAMMQSLFKSIRIEMSAEYENFLFGLQP